MAERTSPPTSQNSVVKNQPPPFEDVNLFASDTVLREAVAREGDAVIDEIVIPGRPPPLKLRRVGLINCVRRSPGEGGRGGTP